MKFSGIFRQSATPGQQTSQQYNAGQKTSASPQSPPPFSKPSFTAPKGGLAAISPAMWLGGLAVFGGVAYYYFWRTPKGHNQLLAIEDEVKKAKNDLRKTTGI